MKNVTLKLITMFFATVIIGHAFVDANNDGIDDTTQTSAAPVIDLKPIEDQIAALEASVGKTASSGLRKEVADLKAAVAANDTAKIKKDLEELQTAVKTFATNASVKKQVDAINTAINKDKRALETRLSGIEDTVADQGAILADHEAKLAEPAKKKMVNAAKDAFKAQLRKVSSSPFALSKGLGDVPACSKFLLNKRELALRSLVPFADQFIEDLNSDDEEQREMAARLIATSFEETAGWYHGDADGVVFQPMEESANGSRSTSTCCANIATHTSKVGNRVKTSEDCVLCSDFSEGFDKSYGVGPDDKLGFKRFGEVYFGNNPIENNTVPQDAVFVTGLSNSGDGNVDAFLKLTTNDSTAKERFSPNAKDNKTLENVQSFFTEGVSSPALKKAFEHNVKDALKAFANKYDKANPEAFQKACMGDLVTLDYGSLFTQKFPDGNKKGKPMLDLTKGREDFLDGVDDQSVTGAKYVEFMGLHKPFLFNLIASCPKLALLINQHRAYTNMQSNSSSNLKKGEAAVQRELPNYEGTNAADVACEKDILENLKDPEKRNAFIAALKAAK